MHFDTNFCIILFFHLIMAVFAVFSNVWQQLLKVRFKHNFLNILRGWKNKSHTALSGVWKFWGYLLSEFCPNMTNGIRKVRLGVEFLILVSPSWTQCFRIWPHLFLAASRIQTDIIVNGGQHSKHSTFYVSISLVSGKREGWEKHRETPPSLHYYFLFFFQVGCTTMLFHTGFCSNTRKWREL